MATVPSAVATLPYHDKIIRAGCSEIGSGKVRHRFRVPPDMLYSGIPEEIPASSSVELMVTSDRLSAYDHVLSGLVPNKGAVLNCLPIWWSQQQGFPRNHLIDYGYDVMRRLFGSVLTPMELNDLTARSVLVWTLPALKAEAVCREYLTGSGYRDYVKSGKTSMYGYPLPDNLQDGSHLGNILWTPSTKADSGHDITITHAKLQELLGTHVADRMRDESIALFRRSQAIANQASLILADTKYEWAILPDGTLILIDEWNTTDSSRWWKLVEWQAALDNGKTPPSHDKEDSRVWCQLHKTPWGIGINNLDPANPEHAQYMLDLVIANAPGGQQMLDDTSSRYCGLFDALTDMTVEEFCIETLGIPLAA